MWIVVVETGHVTGRLLAGRVAELTGRLLAGRVADGTHKQIATRLRQVTGRLLAGPVADGTHKQIATRLRQIAGSGETARTLVGGSRRVNQVTDQSAGDLPPSRLERASRTDLLASQRVESVMSMSVYLHR